MRIDTTKQYTSIPLTEPTYQVALQPPNEGGS